MNKRIAYTIIIIIFSLILSACKKASFNSMESNYKYGVIETTGQENNTYISFYDDSFKKIGEENIKYGSMGDGFSLPLSFGDSMFIVPKGMYSKKELTFIMEYNLYNGEIEKYDTGLQNMNSITVNDDFIYGVNTMDFTSNIVKCNKESKELLKTEIMDIYISYILVHEDELFAFGQGVKDEEMESFLYIIDANTLDGLKKLDITHLGHGHYDGVIVDDKLYFSSSYSIEGMDEEPTNKLIEYSMREGEFIIYELGENFPFQILEFNDNLLITHFDPVGVSGNKISIFNINDGSSEIVELQHNIEHLELDGEDIIILGNGHLYRYNKDFILQNSTIVIADRKTEYNYYTTGLFKR